MILGRPATEQAVLGTLFTWGVTALGAAAVFIEPCLPGGAKGRQKFLDCMLGFAGGVMTAASYWSLLAPAIEMAEQDWYGKASYRMVLPNGIDKEITLAWLPAAVGFAAGGIFLLIGDSMIGRFLQATKDAESVEDAGKDEDLAEVLKAGDRAEGSEGGVRSRRSKTSSPTKDNKGGAAVEEEEDNLELAAATSGSWRRILLLVFAITLHNIPEGLAVGVSFGSLGTEKCKQLDECNFASSFNLALGIGIQNFPEGLAVSMPLRRSGVGLFKSFFFGQLSGMVEPIAGYAGAVMVQEMEPILPYAMAFAAGAMIFVVVDDLVPEATKEGNGRIASIGFMFGFIVMMSLDVALG